MEIKQYNPEQPIAQGNQEEIFKISWNKQTKKWNTTYQNLCKPAKTVLKWKLIMIDKSQH